MEVRKINHPHQMNKTDLPPLSIALGYFDGVHLGHQQVIRQAKEIAEEKGYKSAVMTFDPHPSVVLGKSGREVESITPINVKTQLIEELEIDYLFIVHFTAEFANLLPQEFVDQYIIGLNGKHVVAGFDFTYGKLGKGTMETLPFHSREQFRSTVVPKLANQDKKISSTFIRALIREGKTEALPGVLGRFYTTAGIVVHGDKRGRTLGFPTANIDIDDEYIVPPLGVYAVKILVKGQWYHGVCNIGFKPTFQQEQARKPSIEVHIFDFDADIYGVEVVVEWHRYLRTEKKFAGIEQLVDQIEKDKHNALVYFGEIKV